MTYRDRRLAKAARLREWAEKRAAKAEAASNRAHELSDMLPFGQPILVGHHSERGHRRHLGRIDNAMHTAVDNRRTAQRMESRADNIERAADLAIYSDDEDAIDRLCDKIATLEAERARLKAFNASCRKGARDLSLLDESQQRQYLHTASMFLGKHGEYPSAHSTNLSGTISRLRKRLAALESQQ